MSPPQREEHVLKICVILPANFEEYGVLCFCLISEYYICPILFGYHATSYLSASDWMGIGCIEAARPHPLVFKMIAFFKISRSYVMFIFVRGQSGPSDCALYL